MEQGKGHCKHGEFNLMEGCERCIEEARMEREALKNASRIMAGDTSAVEPLLKAVNLPSAIVKVRYFSEQTQELSAREYTYYSVDRLKVGDIVMVPVRDTTGKAQVTAIDVAESEIVAFKDKVKTIPAGSRLVSQIPDGKPGDEWKAIKPLGPLTGAGPYGVQEEYHCPADCVFYRPSGGPWDNPEIGGCAKEGGVPSDGSFQNNPSLGTLAMYEARPPRGGVVIEPQEFPTAVVRIAPGKDSKVVQLLTEIMRIKEWADKLVVASIPDARKATDDLSIMGRLKKAVEEKRQEYVGPLNTHVKAVNDSFKLLSGPLEIADKTARSKVTAFNLEMQHRQREAEEVNRAAIEIARKQAELHQGEFTVDITPVEVVEAPRLTRTEMASSGLADNWKWKVVDMSLVPREYLVVDSAMLNAIAKKHHDSKPVAGIEFYNEPGLRVYNK